MKFRYFLLGNSVPIRAVFNDEGHRIGAEVPSREARMLDKDATYLSRLDHSMEVDEINQEDFERHCKRVWDTRGIAKWSEKYFLFESFLPIAVRCDEKGNMRDAQVPDATARQLRSDPNYLLEITHNLRIKKIDHATFDRLCKDHWDARGIPE